MGKRISVKTYGFFHPYCNAGGGGERVLWQAVEDTLKRREAVVTVYTGDEDTDEQIFANVQKRFGISLDEKRVSFVKLSWRWMVDPAQWPLLTLLGQALGSVMLAAEAIYKFKPDVWIDTMGYPFTYPLVWFWVGVPIVAYVHFPVISEDMLGKLHPSVTSVYGIRQLLKFVYWKMFMSAYRIVGSFVNVTLTNSTWTKNHIESIWTLNSDIEILYPPCSTEKFISEADINTHIWNRENSIICLAQFRPEKRHGLIINEYAQYLKSCDLSNAPKLIFIGSIRGDEDRAYVNQLQTLASEMSQIEFILDAKYEVVQEYLRKCSFGLNAMWNEHFGIAVVEYVASGLVPIVHASAGPLMDIVVPWDSENQCDSQENDDTTRTGFFFKSETDPDYKPENDVEYPKLHEVFASAASLTEEQKLTLTKRGKQCVLEKFSDEKFDNGWDHVLVTTDGIKRRHMENVHLTLTILFVGFIIKAVSR